MNDVLESVIDVGSGYFLSIANNVNSISFV